MQSDDIPNTDIGFWLEYYVEVKPVVQTDLFSQSTILFAQ